MNESRDAEATAAHLGHKRQLEWSPAIANGAALIALSGIVANATDQDSALSALTLPLALHGAGILSAALSLHYSGKATDKRFSFCDIAQDLTATVNPVVHTYNAADGEEKATAGKTLQVLTSRVAADHARLVPLLASYRAFDRLARWLAASSIALCALGFVGLLAGHHLGFIRLAP